MTAAKKETELTKGQQFVQGLRKMHSATSVEAKDFSLQDLFDSKKKEVEISVIGFASKFVPKYCSDTNPGYHTMIYLEDGKKIGAFSSALLYFAQEFYELAKLDCSAKFNRIMFDGALRVKVSQVDLDGGKKRTYNFEIIDGSINGLTERMGGGAALSSAVQLQLSAAAPESTPE